MAPNRQFRFVRDEAGLLDFKQRLKLMRCPHCGKSETLNAHGPLRGYAEQSSERVVRGWRAYCSNRGRRLGCGRTFSALLSEVLCGFSTTASTLERFASGVLDGLRRSESWRLSAPWQSLRNGYRLWQRLYFAQSHLRSKLLAEASVPTTASDQPLESLRQHLKRVLNVDYQLFSQFQERFQVGLLG